MERHQLQRWLNEGLSLSTIAAIVDRHPSTVAYWVQKHGLRASGQARHAAKGALTRELLEPLVRSGATLEEIANEVARSKATVRYWLKKFDLKTQNRRGPRPRARPGPAERLLQCKRHGMTPFVLRKDERTYRCKQCRSEAVSRRRRKLKAMLVEEAGGRCTLCGYDRCIAALQFHHLDPSTKSFGVSRNGVTRRLDLLRDEIAKCVLLCGNCHTEVEVRLRQVMPR
jgi:transposase